MDRLYVIFHTAAAKARHGKDSFVCSSLKICAGWQALETNGYSKAYRAGKVACITGIFIASAFGLNLEGLIGAGLGLTDELSFLSRMGEDVSAPSKDIV